MTEKLYEVDSYVQNFTAQVVSCTPVPGDPVVGFITRGFGVSVHRADCPNASDAKRAEEPGRWIRVDWATGELASYQTALDISAKDRDGLTLDVAMALSAAKVKTTSLSARSMPDGYATVSIVLEVKNQEELTNVINRIVQHMNHRFVLRVVEDEFKSHDFGSTKELLLHDLPAKRATVLYDVNEKQILERLKAIIEVKEKSETTVPITQEHIDKVKKYLLMLDLIVNCPERYESGKQAEHIVFSQPGMRYAIAKALVYSLMQDAYFASISEADKAYITGKILDDVKGRMLEDIVLLEVRKTAPSTMEAFKFKFDAGGEFDMVIYDKTNQNCRIYEIKHSTEANEKQTLHLRDAEKCQIVEKRFGPISGKFVLYRGKDTLAEGVQYLNVENYLCGLK